MDQTLLSSQNKSSRISGHLLGMYQEYKDLTSRNENGLSSSSDIVQFDSSGENIAVRITAHDVENLLPSLEEMGFKVIGLESELHFLEGWMPIERIPELESLDEQGLMGVLPIAPPRTKTGLVTSQADFVLEAQRVRASLPEDFDGTGVTIGVLSDSYNVSGNGSAAEDIASGDLPANGVDVLEEIPSELTEFAIDEGRAMLQLIHDIAPGADLKFATALPTPTKFADNIRALADAGADIIVDDIGLPQPFFQDGVIAQAVDDVVTKNGALYFSATGNDGNIAYESANINFASDTIDGITGNFYDFDPSDKVDTRQLITIPNGDGVNLDFQWDDPFYTTNGVDTDLDIYLLNATTGEIVASSAEDNISSQTPFESFFFENNTDQTDFEVAIELFDGPKPGRIKYIPFGLGGFNSDPATIYQEFATNSSTIFGQPAASNASAVAAAPYYDQKNPQLFTSVGPTTILFETDGTRKTTPEIRQKPDITAIDDIDTTFFGDNINDDIDGNGFPNFAGTSAAAPHAAAVAALVKQANPEFTPQQIYNRLESTAEDIGAPGRDNVTGAGLINAYDAIFGPVVPASLNFTDDFEDGELSSAYETRSNGAGRIQVTSANNPIGKRHLTLDGFVDINGKNSLNDFGINIENSLNEVILHVDTTNSTDVKLSFDQREFRDGDNPMPEKFVGSNNSDGVALSVDGTNWYRLISLTGDNSPQHYQTKTFDLTKFATQNHLTLGENVQIKFQQFDDLAINTTDPSKPSDGMAFDNISVTGSAIPTKPESPELISGTPGDDLFIAGIPGSKFDGKNDILFTGAGNDEVDTQSIADAGGNRISTGSGDDIIFVSHGDRAFGGTGSDTLDATEARGDNRMSGGAGDDTFFLGKNDRAIGGSGNDQFYVQSGGDNVITGGTGDDQFWIVSGELPLSGNTITDFEIGEDVIGILGAESLGISSDSLKVNQVGDSTEISFGDRTLAILSNQEASLLDTNDNSQFIFA